MKKYYQKVKKYVNEAHEFLEPTGHSYSITKRFLVGELGLSPAETHKLIIEMKEDGYVDYYDENGTIIFYHHFLYGDDMA